MHPVVRGALYVAVLASASSYAGLRSRPHVLTVFRTQKDKASEELSSLCPKGFLPDLTSCIPFPENPGNESPLSPSTNAHRERTGQWRVYEQVPRRPDRPADYARYRYPVPAPAQGNLLMSEYDLDRPDPLQRRGPNLSAVGHGGVDLAQARGTPVQSVTLENQVGETEVVFVGKLFGTTVVTLHSLQEGGRLKQYVAIHGHLEAPAPNLAAGARVAEGDVIGFVGDSGSEGIVHLHYEVRQVRDGVDPQIIRSSSLASPAVSMPCDPRNVLPMTR